MNKIENSLPGGLTGKVAAVGKQTQSELTGNVTVWHHQDIKVCEIKLLSGCKMI